MAKTKDNLEGLEIERSGSFRCKQMMQIGGMVDKLHLTTFFIFCEESVLLWMPEKRWEDRDARFGTKREWIDVKVKE